MMKKRISFSLCDHFSLSISSRSNVSLTVDFRCAADATECSIVSVQVCIRKSLRVFFMRNCSILILSEARYHRHIFNTSLRSPKSFRISAIG